MGGTWTRAPHLQAPRSAHAVVALDGALYALGGVPVEVERFDGECWTFDAELPAGALNAAAAVALDGSIVVTGGFVGTTNLPTAEVHVYDPRAGDWAEAAPLPAPRGGHGAALLDGRVHVLGGGNSERTLADHSVYDPDDGAWQDAAPLPRAQGSPAAVVFEGRLHAIGGRSGLDDFGDVYVYDAERDVWEDGPPIPPRGTAGAAVYDDALWVFGGESQATESTLDEVLCLRDGAWERAEPLPTARNYARAAVLDGAVYVVGGSVSAGSSHSALGSRVVERFAV